jgi:hypothetical protein
MKEGKEMMDWPSIQGSKSILYGWDSETQLTYLL